MHAPKHVWRMCRKYFNCQIINKIMYTDARMHVCVCVCMCTCMYVYVYVLCVCMCICICICVCVCMCMCVCVCVYMYASCTHDDLQFFFPPLSQVLWSRIGYGLGHFLQSLELSNRNNYACSLKDKIIYLSYSLTDIQTRIITQTWITLQAHILNLRYVHVRSYNNNYVV